jgi:hypothetical protein
MVNYIAHLESVFMKFVEDDRTSPWHFSLYMAMFHIWNNSMFRDEINVRRDEMMMLSKIGSANTYTRCMQQLSEWGYIAYHPSNSKYKSSKVHMYRFDNGADKGSDKGGGNGSDKGSDNAPVQHLRPFINYNKTIENNLNTTNMSKGELHSPDRTKNSEANPSSSKTRQRFVPPSSEEVKSFFSENKVNNLEAEKFYNHFQSNGWLVGGRTKMKDWKAAARSWILRSAKYAEQANPTLQRLNAKQNTKYDEPL